MLDAKRSRARNLLEPGGSHREHFAAQHIPYFSGVSDDIIMLRDGDLMASFVVDGIAAETADETAVDELAYAMGKAVAQAKPDIGFYIHRFSIPVWPQLEPVDPAVSPFAAAIDRAWQSHVGSIGLRSRQTMVTITIRPSKVGSLWARLTSGAANDQRSHREVRIERLNQTVDFLMQAVRAAHPTRLTLSDGAWIGLLRATMSGRYYPSPPSGVFRPLADLIVTSQIDFKADTFVSLGGDSAETCFGTIFSLKDYPTVTAAGIFGKFDLPFDMVITQSFTPTDPFEAQKRIQRTSRQMSAADDAAASLREQLVDAADDVASGHISMGLHHATIAVFETTEARLDAAAAAIRTAAQKARCVVTRESIGSRAAFFAQHPGNYSYRARAAMISNQNFADYTALHATPPGLPANRTPWGEAVTVLPDTHGAPHRFNFHLGGENDERTVGHTLFIGMTGAGKTLGAAFLLAQARRLNPRIIAFDKDCGLELPIRALGGTYSAVRMGEPTGFNPIATESDERGTAWLTQWLEATLSNQGELNAKQRQALANATRANKETDPALRTMRQFRTQFRSVDDGLDLHTRLGIWDDGQYGWLFSGQQASDPLTFDQDVTAFDLTEIFDAQEVRTAWLAYVFRRIERVIEDERPTIILIDEAWKVLDDRFFEAMLKDWALTLRKKNVVLILMTQRVDHLRQSAAGGAILESCVTTILYPNARFTLDEISPLNLTEAEAEFVTSSSLGGRVALIRSGDTSTIVDMDLSALGPLLTVLSGACDEAALEALRDKPDFWKELS